MATIADTIRKALSEGMNNEQVLSAVRVAHPESNTTAACVSYYRSKMKKAGAATKSAAKASTPSPMALLVSASTSMSVYSVRNVKSFIGNEGQGFNATLYRDDKAVAFVYDDASGGPVTFEWKDFSGGKVEVEVEAYGGKTHIAGMTLEEKALHDFTKALPHSVCSWNDPSTGEPAIMVVDSEIFVSDMVNDVILLKTIRRMTKAKVVFALNGEVYSVKCAPTAENMAKVEANNVGALIINDLSDAQALKAFRGLN